jgi:hypothetical protein
LIAGAEGLNHSRDRQIGEELQQAQIAPEVLAQVAALDQLMAGGDQQGLLAGVARTAGLLVENDVGHDSARRNLGLRGRPAFAGGMPVSDPGGLSASPSSLMIAPSIGQMLAHCASAKSPQAFGTFVGLDQEVRCRFA